MGGLGHHHHPVLSTISASVILLLLLCSAAIVSADQYYSRTHHQELSDMEVDRRRWLIGSSPPTCRSKCGRCSPCVAVHVAIQPGVSMPLEYYPEAWRCKCGNNLYMP